MADSNKRSSLLRSEFNTAVKSYVAWVPRKKVFCICKLYNNVSLGVQIKLRLGDIIFAFFSKLSAIKLVFNGVWKLAESRYFQKLILVWRYMCDRTVVWHDISATTHLCNLIFVWPDICVTWHLCDKTLMWPNIHVTKQLCNLTLVWPDTYVTWHLCDLTVVWPDICVTRQLCDLTLM